MASRSSTSSFASTVSFESLLEKQGKLPGSFMVKKYWCVLDNGKLTYYKDAKKNMAVGGSIDVSQIQSVMRSHKGQAFNIITNSATHSFTAASFELRDQWVKALQDAMTVWNRKQSAARQSTLMRASVNQSLDSEEPPMSPASPLSPGPTVCGSQTAQSSHFPVTSPPAVSPSPPSSSIKSTGVVSTAPVEVVNKPQLETSETEALDSMEFSYVNAADVQRALHGMTGPAAAAGNHQMPRVESHLSDVDDPQEEKDFVSKVEKAPQQDADVTTQAQPEITSSSAPIPKPRRSRVSPRSTVSQDEQNVEAPVIEEEVATVNNTSAPFSQSTKAELVEEQSETAQPGKTNHHADHDCHISEFPTAPENAETNSVADQKPQRKVLMRPQSRQPSNAAPPPEKESQPAPAVIEIRVEDFDFNSPPVVDLPNPRLDGDTGLAFDQLRTFIDNNCHKSKNDAGPVITRPGQAVESLKYFLANLD